MAGRGVPERLSWAVDILAVEPDDRLLEIGPGYGVSVDLICQRLRTGTVVAIDRSAKMTRVASERNAVHVAAGRAVFRTVALADAEFPDGCFDKVLAANINLFWTGSPTAELALIRRILAPGGALYLCYEPPTAARAEELGGTLALVLTDHGYAVSRHTGTTSRGAALLCLQALPPSP